VFRGRSALAFLLLGSVHLDLDFNATSCATARYTSLYLTTSLLMTALLLNATLDDFASNFNWSSAWTAPDTSPVGYPNGDSFLSTLVDGTYHETSVNSQTTLSFAGELLPAPNPTCLR